jgi:hypothetical protein
LKRFWLWVVGALVAGGLAGHVELADARVLPSQLMRHHEVEKTHLTWTGSGRSLPAPRPSAPAPSHDRSSHHAAMPRVNHSSHHRGGQKSWDQHALDAPSYESNSQDPGDRIGLKSGFLIQSQEHPVISGRGPPPVHLNRFLLHHPVQPHPSSPILQDLNPTPTAAGPSRDPDRVLFPRAPVLAGRPAFDSTHDVGHKGQTQQLCHLASRPKGAVAGHLEPFVGGAS